VCGARRAVSVPAIVLRPLALALVALLSTVVLASAAHAAAETETAALGTVSATFSYEKSGDFEYRGMAIDITRAGAAAFHGVADAPDCVRPYCAPGSAVGEGSLHVSDLDGDGEPEVVVDLYTGGAHCCLVTEILWWNGTQYTPATRNFADFGYRLDGTTFVSGDARFAYSFTAFAFSAMPVRLLTFSRGAWRDVTREHPDTLRADAARWLKEYKKHRNGTRGLGLLAAWVADEYRLGAPARTAADAFLTHELRAGRLRGDRIWPQRKAYISALQRRLRAWGYAR
jgi:hypothetical protein